MQKRNALLLLAAIAGLLLFTFLSDRSAPPVYEAKVEKTTASPAPDFSFTTLDGAKMKLSDLRGRAILLNFWATWCAPCRLEIPSMLKVVEESRGQLVLLAVSVDTDEKAVRKFMKGMSGALVVMDAERKISQDIFQTIRYPETILIDRDGLMIKKIAGGMDWSAPAGKKEIDALLK